MILFHTQFSKGTRGGSKCLRKNSNSDLCRIYVYIQKIFKKEYLWDFWFVYLMVLRLLQQGVGISEKSSSHQDSIWLPNVSLLKDYEKHSIYIGSVSSECLLKLSHTFLAEFNKILHHMDWNK